MNFCKGFNSCEGFINDILPSDFNEGSFKTQKVWKSKKYEGGIKKEQRFSA